MVWRYCWFLLLWCWHWGSWSHQQQSRGKREGANFDTIVNSKTVVHINSYREALLDTGYIRTLTYWSCYFPWWLRVPSCCLQPILHSGVCWSIISLRIVTRHISVILEYHVLQLVWKNTLFKFCKNKKWNIFYLNFVNTFINKSAIPGLILMFDTKKHYFSPAFEV